MLEITVWDVQHGSCSQRAELGACPEIYGDVSVIWSLYVRSGFTGGGTGNFLNVTTSRVNVNAALARALGGRP